MEDYVATDVYPLHKCLADVAACDLYVGLLGWRYGYIPDRDNLEHKSITELEYRRAGVAKLPRLMFLADKSAPWPDEFKDEITSKGDGGKHIAALRAEVEREKLVSHFTTPEQLASLVSVAVQRGLANRPSAAIRVCIISSEYPPHVEGGLGVHVDQLSTALGAFIDVDVVLPYNEKEYHTPPKGVFLWPMAKVQASYNSPTSWLYFAKHMPDSVCSKLPDIIHCHDWVTVLGGIICRWKYKIPLVYHVHLPNMSPLCSSVENLGLVCADLVTVNSETIRTEIRDRGLQIRRIEVVPNGVDTNTFVQSTEWPVDGEYILFVGRLVEQKGVEYLLRAFLYVREKFPDIRLKIVGTGPCGPALERLATNLMIREKTEFLGWKEGVELVKLYQAARIVVIPSIYEPFGMIALEAMACKRPVVASRIGGLEEIVKHKITGFLSEPKSYLDLAQWIMALLDNETRRQEMGKRAQDQARNTCYQWPSIALKFIGFYEDLLGNEVDLEVPKKAADFRSQIEDVAMELEPALKDNKSLLNCLFSWMEKP